MTMARSKVTSQGQISVPASVRRKLGLEPGSVLEWKEEGDRVVVQRAGGRTFEEIRKALFPEGPPKRASLKQINEAKAEYIRDQHARGRY